jgi:nickel/cobalt transporter (NicO) family protein
MMAAFIIAIRGTVTQAIMLGLAATISHTAIVWIVALLGIYLGSQLQGDFVEAYFQIASAILIIGMALWMFYRLYKQNQAHVSHDYHHGHSHDHHSHTHEDSHALKHAQDIEKNFSRGTATNSQIIMFGLTGGLIPCPASITILLICLQLKRITLGAVLVLSFSIGLALTLVIA